jgi:DNA-directed RNA polymerase specialized sigma24 family protein
MTPTPANDNRPASFDALLAKYDPFIRSKCCGDEDLYQDIRLLAIERWYRYRQDGNFVSWVSYLVREVISQRARKIARAEKWLPYTPPSHTEPSQEHAAGATQALGALSQAERDAVSLIATGHTGDEAGRVMGVSRQRVWQVVERGRERLAANDNVLARKAA